MTDIAITDNTSLQRYEARVGGELAGLCEYRLRGDLLEITHTEVLPAFEGHGVGSALARHALDGARRRGLHVLPSCEFVAGWIGKHPGYADLLRS